MPDDGNWYIAYADDVTATVEGPFDTVQEATAAAQERFGEDEEATDNEDMVVLKVAARLKMTRKVEIEIEEVE